MKKISGPVGRKIVVAAFLVAVLVGSGVYAIALSAKSRSAEVPQNTEMSQGPATSIDYRIYDMFETPFGPWWPARTSFYSTDYIVSDEPNMNAMLFLPTRSVAMAYQGLLYAPYRYSIDAVDVTTLNMSRPEFMPVMGAASNGEAATINIYFQYIYQTWWDQYWIPTWSGSPGWPGDTWNVRSGADGYDLGTVYEVVMNRAAALHWLNMPLAADPVTWWATNGAAYRTSWVNWILNEGNTRLDIWCGYEWPYDINGGTFMNVHVDGLGNVVLDIGELALGYEILMDRWLNETRISPGLQCYYEDFSLTAVYGVDNADFNSDAAVQYSLHAVKGNKTANTAAWVWEPARIDYTVRGTHPSDYKPYASLDYQSWNAGDTLYGASVPYEQTPNWFNLTAGETLTIELPTGVVPCYKPVALAESDYDNLTTLNDRSAFYNIMDNGTVGLAYWITGLGGTMGIDMTNMYDPLSKTLTITGPYRFDQFYHKPATKALLYHGTPWIEFWADRAGPTAQAGPDILGVTAGDTVVQFDGTSSTDDVRLYNWTWTFTDGGTPVTLYGPTPTYVFQAMGDVVVTLVVMDSIGNVALDTLTVHVDFIPEFPTVIIPIAASLALIVVFRKRKP